LLTYVREAIADAALVAFLGERLETGIAPALPDLPVRGDWAQVSRREFRRDPPLRAAMTGAAG
jgi:hypothetical protein